jgi:hypothetical protein
LVGGLVFGILDRMLAHGPEWTLDLSNVACFWLAAAFLAGLTTRSHTAGALLGLLSLLAALVSYYGYMYTVEHVTSLRYLQWRASPWVVAALLVGPMFGALGTDWRVRRAPVAMMILAGAFCLDGLGYAAVEGGRDGLNTVVHLGVVMLGVLLGTAFLLARRRSPTSQPPRGRV